MEHGTFAVDTATRRVRGILIPWGERSRTSASKTKPITFPRGSITIPRDPSVASLNLEHDRFSPLGRGAVFEDQEAGLYAEFDIADTEEGDAWLADHGSHVKLSAEVRDIERDAADFGRATLTGAALVTEGAFESAALFAIDAEEKPTADDLAAEALENMKDAARSFVAAVDAIPTTPDEASASEDTKPDGEPDEEKEDAVADATASEVMLAKRDVTPEKKDSGPSRTAFFRMIDDVMGGRANAETRRLVADSLSGGEAGMFALADVDYNGAGGVGAQMTPAQWIGEVPTLLYVPVWGDLFETKPLTSLTLGGWKWGTKPAGGTWTGNKDAIPSNTPTVTPVSDTATRWAGGHDIAREHRDFGTPGFFESYNEAMRNSYEQWKDTTIVRTEVLAGATDIEADNPTGLTIGAGWSALIDGAAQVIANGYTPTFAQVELSLWKAMMKVPNSDTLGYLEAALNLEAGTLSGFSFRPVTGITAGHIIVGARAGATVFELGGASPLRAEALNIANGGIDVGHFGYAGLLINDAAAIVDVAPYTP